MKQQKNKKTDFHKQLQAYSALGTAFLALAPQQAEADIVYVDIPDFEVCVEATEVRDGSYSSSENTRYLYIDFDGQQVETSSLSGQDMYFTIAASAEEDGTDDQGQAFFSAWGYDGTASKIMGVSTYNTLESSTYYRVRNMPYGATISSAVTRATNDNYIGFGFEEETNNSTTYTTTWFKGGEPSWLVGFPNVQGVTGYIGVEFPIGGQDHYAWVRIKADFQVDMQAGQDIYSKACVTILDYAYNDTPGEKILAGEGATASPPASIPTLSEWGLLNLALLLMTFGTIYLIQPNFSLRKVARREEE
ncbi:MAG: hypothetical protein R3E32_11315 [Chitinophagales bacterium]